MTASKAQQKKQLAAGTQAKQETAYSYQRFSSEIQGQGDSIRRQNESAISYAIQHNLKLDESTTIKDLGVSAYKNKNMESNLGTFIKAIEDKKIPTPCHLLLESLDRYSRRPAIESLLSLYTQLVNKDVTVHIVKSGHVIDKASLLNPISIIIPLMEFSRSHEESKTKSIRIRASWNKKQQNASINNPLTKKCPGWIDVINDKYVINKEHAKTVKLIINMGLDGYGATAIARHLNQNNIPTMTKRKRKHANRWDNGMTRHYLSDKSLIGFHQFTTLDDNTGKRVNAGDEIKLYPAIIDENTYYKLQGIIAKRSKNTRGREGKNIANLFGQMMTDYDDKSVIKIQQKGKNENVLMTSSSSISGASDSKSFQYEVFEQSLMTWLSDMRIDIVKNNNSEATDIDSIESQIEINNNKLIEINKGIEESEDINDVKSLVAISKKIESKINGLRIELADAKIKESSPNANDDIFTLKESMNLKDYDSRAKMRTSLNNLIDSIVVASRPINQIKRMLHAMINLKDGTTVYMTIRKDRGNDIFMYHSDNHTGKEYNNLKHFGTWLKNPVYDNQPGHIVWA